MLPLLSSFGRIFALFNMLKKGFRGPAPSSNCKSVVREKGKNIAVTCPGEEGISVLPPDPLKGMSQFLDPLSIELIKSCLGEPSYFDSQDFQRSFKQLIDDCKEILTHMCT